MTTEPTTPNDSLQKNIQLTHIIYALQAASFLLGITFIAAVIINYVKRKDVQGTFLESHFTWQIKTFWYGLIGSIIGLITMVVFIGIFVLIGVGIWTIYRIVKGWLKLKDGLPVGV